MLLRCQRCGNEWDYKGKRTHFATCSKCKTSVRLRPRDKKPKPIYPEIQPQSRYPPRPQSTYYPSPAPAPTPIISAKSIETSSRDKQGVASEKELKKEESLVACPGCYRNIRIGSKFCRECGYKYFCPYCEEGLIGYEDKTFCVKCGESLEGEEEEEEEEEKKDFWSPEHQEMANEWLRMNFKL